MTPEPGPMPGYMNVKAEHLISTYKEADDNGKQLLERLYGEDTFAVIKLENRIKTFEDAVEVLGVEDPLIHEYNGVMDALMTIGRDYDTDLKLFLTLRIITAAINSVIVEDNEWRYTPYFCYYAKDRDYKASEGERYLVKFKDNSCAKLCGSTALAYNKHLYDAPTRVCPLFSFRSEPAAVYAGQQFFELWIKFLFPEKYE